MYYIYIVYRLRVLLAQSNRIQRPPADTWTAGQLTVLQLTHNPLGISSRKKYLVGKDVIGKKNSLNC